MPSHTHVLLVNPSNIKLYGHIPAMLLSQIEFWLHRAKGGKSFFVVERFGKKWAALSAQKLMDELVLTASQYRLARTRLIEAGAITSERHLFNNLVTAHFRVLICATCRGKMVDPTHTGWKDSVSTGCEKCDQIGFASLAQIL